MSAADRIGSRPVAGGPSGASPASPEAYRVPGICPNPTATALIGGPDRPKDHGMYTRPLDDVSAPPAPEGEGDATEVIRTDGLTKTYPGRANGPLTAVDHLQLSVRSGEIFGLLGPNGAGKTTTVGMLTTRVVPTGGLAWIAGIDVVAHPTAAKRVLGVVSQTNTLDRSLTVWENLYHHGQDFAMTTHDARA